MNEVYIVYLYFGPGAEVVVDSVWSTQDLAFKRMAQTTKENVKFLYGPTARLMTLPMDEVPDKC